MKLQTAALLMSLSFAGVYLMSALLRPNLLDRLTNNAVSIPTGFRFSIRELVHPLIYQEFGDRSWAFFMQSVLDGLHAARTAWGKPLVINDWDSGRVNSGLRTLDSEVGAENSRHKLAVAFDFRFPDPSEKKKFVEFIQRNFYKFNVVRMENPEKTAGWVHLEFGETNAKPSRLIIFNP